MEFERNLQNRILLVVYHTSVLCMGVDTNCSVFVCDVCDWIVLFVICIQVNKYFENFFVFYLVLNSLLQILYCKIDPQIPYKIVFHTMCVLCHLSHSVDLFSYCDLFFSMVVCYDMNIFSLFSETTGVILNFGV